MFNETPGSAGYAALYQQAYAPVFFNKLASYGINPQSEEEAASMLRMAGKLRNAHDANLVKTAAVNRLAAFEQSLDGVLGYNANDVQVSAENHYFKQAAMQLAQNADLVNAVVAYQDECATAALQA